MNHIDSNPALTLLEMAKEGPLPVNEPSFLAAAAALQAPTLRLQRPDEIKVVLSDALGAIEEWPVVLAPAKRLTATQRLVRQPVYTRRQPLPSNFTPWLCQQPRAITEATTMPHADLVAMLDREHPEGARFVVVAKNTSRNIHVVTVLDLNAKRFYRATTRGGVFGFWKHIARQRPHVQLLTKHESFEG
jgi:hypothetical protein